MSDKSNYSRVPRRWVLRAGGAGAATTLAGCMGNDSPDSTDDTGEDGGQNTDTDSGGSSDGSSKDRLVVALPAEQSSLDPANQYTSYGAEWVYSMYSGLLRVDYDWENDELVYGVPDLAESYEILQQDGEYLAQFSLRDGVTFHNGDELDAELVKKEMDYWFDSNTATGQTLAPIVTQTSIENDMTVNVHFGEEPFAPFEKNFSGLLGNPYVREEVGKGEFATNPEGGGSGPYKFSSYTSGSEIVLERYDDYYRDDLAQFEEIVFKIMPEGSTRMSQLRTGGIDLDGFISYNNWSSLEDDDEITTRRSPASMWGCTIFNHEANEAFADRRVRKALLLAVDRAQYGQAVFDGIYEPVSIPTLPDTWWEFSDLTKQNRYDLEQSKQLMEDAGYSDGFEMTLQAGSDSWHQTMAQVIKSMWSQLNVQVTIEPMEAQTMWTEIAQGNYTAAVSENLGGPDPDHFLYNYCHPDGPWTTITQGWEDNVASENSHVFDLLAEQRGQMDRDARKETLREIYKILNEEVPYHFYVNGYNVAAHQPELEDYWLYPGDYSREALRQVSWES